ncbi:MAG: efflux RND transporter periplasmic adaptor subunit [Alphaproteobacteria bacterium]|nr:efflux RND transporter periplasmic adaptor subunit [Alphaproteobacteria bacterium]
MKRLIIGGVVVAAVAIAGYMVLSAGDSKAEYRLGSVTRGRIANSVSATGTLGAVVTVQVGSQISGQIAKLYVDFNSRVAADQAIAQIDAATFEARVVQAQADLAIAQANVIQQGAAIDRARADRDTAKSIMDDAGRDLARKRELQSGGNVAKSALDTASAVYTQAEARFRSSEAALKIAEAQLETAKAQVTQREAALNSAQVDLDRTTIRSPVDGVVISRNIDVGQTVAASLQAPILFEIAQDLAQMELQAVIDEADIGRVHEGQTAAFTVDAYPQRQFSGEVKQVRLAPKTVQNVVTYTVIISASNPQGQLLPGMTANVEISDEVHEDVLMVPNAALRFRPEADSGGPSANAGGGARGSGSSGFAAQMQERTKRMKEGLALTGEQSAQFDEIQARFAQRAGAIRQSAAGGGDVQGVGDQMRKSYEQMMNEVAAILTDDQKAKLEAIRGAARDASQGERLRPGRLYVLSGGKPKAVTVMTGLSDGTSTEIRSDDLKEADKVIVGLVAPLPAVSASSSRRPPGFGF